MAEELASAVAIETGFDIGVSGLHWVLPHQLGSVLFGGPVAVERSNSRGMMRGISVRVRYQWTVECENFPLSSTTLRPAYTKPS
jgi:hypothetical protein